MDHATQSDWEAADWVVRQHAPAVLAEAGDIEAAGLLRALAPIRDINALDRGALPILDAAHGRAYAAWEVVAAAARPPLLGDEHPNSTRVFVETWRSLEGSQEAQQAWRAKGQAYRLYHLVSSWVTTRRISDPHQEVSIWSAADFAEWTKSPEAEEGDYGWANHLLWAGLAVPR